MQTVWKGAISFGLLNVPVKMGAATSRESISFRMLHKECNTPISQKKFCSKCNKEISNDDIVKGYEYEPGKFVILTEEDFEAVPIKTAKYINIVDFIKLEEVDPVYYDKTYYLWPEKGGEKPYLILRNAMKETGRVAVAKVTIRQKEHFCLVRLIDDTLALETMFYPNEVRAKDELGIDAIEKSIEIRPAEMDMAVKLVENLTASFDPEKYKDNYREELLKIIRAKIEGQQIVEAPDIPQSSNIIDLMERLRQSVEATKKKADDKSPDKKGTAETDKKTQKKGKGRKKAAGG